jgi:hypothetical protein
MDVMDVICAFCELGREGEKERLEASGERRVKKYTYTLPSGRKVIVVLDDESELVGVPA